MARMTYHGGDEFADQLLMLGKKGYGIAHRMLYEGAGLVADSLKNAAESLAVGTAKGNSETGHPFTGLTPEDKAEIVNALGIAEFDDTGDSVNTAIAFSGYLSRTEDAYPNGVPIPMILRSIESGSSVRVKQPFIRPAVNAVRSKVLETMGNVADEEINKIMG